MTELYINGRRVVLPQSLNIPIIEENPFFTKNGVYTLDFVLSLTNDTNAQVYEHINRLNVVDRLELNRTAYLVVDNMVKLNGTEIITDISDTDVTIQLVSGNSELNFLIGGDKKLRSLDLGKADVYTNLSSADKIKRVFEDLKKSYPERNYQFIPYCTGPGNVNVSAPNRSLNVGNNYALLPKNIEGTDRSEFYPALTAYNSGSVAQPYLCFIIESVFKALGYTLTENAIAIHPVLRNMYIVHGFRTVHFAKMLPSWTVVEFFSKIEEWLDCVFIIDPYKKSVRLLFNYQSDDATSDVVSLDIEDKFNINIDNSNAITVHNANIRYSLDNEPYYDFMALDENILAKAVWYTPNLPLSEWVKANDLQTGMFQYIYSLTDTTDRFITDQLNGTRTLRKVDSFRSLFNNPYSMDIDIDIDIIPASMEYAYLYAIYVNDISFWLQIPIAGDYDPLLDKDEEIPDPDTAPINIQSLVRGESSMEKEESYSKMRMAIYSGLQKMDLRDGSPPSWIDTTRYPIAYVESLAEYFPKTKRERYFGKKGINPFRLDYLDSEIYSKTQSIDSRRAFQMTFSDSGKIDITSKFIANNKAFRCIKIERTVTIDGLSEKVKGDFYAYKNIN